MTPVAGAHAPCHVLPAFLAHAGLNENYLLMAANNLKPILTLIIASAKPLSDNYRVDKAISINHLHLYLNKSSKMIF